MRQFLSEYSLEGLWLLALAVILVTMLVGCSGSPTRESTGEFTDDGAIRSDAPR